MEACRRVRRSSVPSVALEFLLEAELERHQGIAVALGTMEGMALAGVGDVEPWRITTAAAKKLVGELEHPMIAAFGATPFRMTILDLPEGARVVLTSIGATGLSSDVENGVLRILS